MLLLSWSRVLQNAMKLPSSQQKTESPNKQMMIELLTAIIYFVGVQSNAVSSPPPTWAFIETMEQSDTHGGFAVECHIHAAVWKLPGWSSLVCRHVFGTFNFIVSSFLGCFIQLLSRHSNRNALTSVKNRTAMYYKLSHPNCFSLYYFTHCIYALYSNHVERNL